MNNKSLLIICSIIICKARNIKNHPICNYDTMKNVFETACEQMKYDTENNEHSNEKTLANLSLKTTAEIIHYCCYHSCSKFFCNVF